MSEALVRSVTTVATVPLVPELRLRLLVPSNPLWYATPEEAAAQGLVLPYWAVAWPGGQALARWLLDHSEAVAGRQVLDVGSGGAIEGVAAARAGASAVCCADVDPLAAIAASLNAGLNGVAARFGSLASCGRGSRTGARAMRGTAPDRSERAMGPRQPSAPGGKLADGRTASPMAPVLTATVDDPLGRPAADFDCGVVLVGDLTFDEDITARLVPWLRAHAALGRTVLVGDAGRVPLPEDFIVQATYQAPFDGNPFGSTDWPVTVRTPVCP